MLAKWLHYLACFWADIIICMFTQLWASFLINYSYSQLLKGLLTQGWLKWISHKMIRSHTNLTKNDRISLKISCLHCNCTWKEYICLKSCLKGCWKGYIGCRKGPERLFCTWNGWICCCKAAVGWIWKEKESCTKEKEKKIYFRCVLLKICWIYCCWPL